MGLTARSIELVNKILNLIDGLDVDYKKKTDIKGSFKTRALNGPSLLESHGLVPLLTYLASKSGGEPVYQSVVGGNFNELKNKSKEELGYVLYLRLVVKYLQEDLRTFDGSEWNKLIDSIKELDSNPHVVSAISEVVEDFLVEVKKVAEALIPDEREKG